MYQYDTYDHEAVQERVAQFRKQVARRLNGELTEDEFKPLRLMNGLYLQLHAYMLRIAIPYGTLSSDQMRLLAHIARSYDKGYGHFTTRQNIQFHWIKLEETPDLLEELAHGEMHAIQTSGNCVRNVTADHFAGAAHDEADDPRIYAELLRQWSSFHPEFSYLPRKFKIAISGSPIDRAAISVHDIGIRLFRDENNQLRMTVTAGGGLGRTPYLGSVMHEALETQHLLSFIEAIVRVYNELGRRDNLYKARIKILVQSLGGEVMRDKVHEEWHKIKDGALAVPPDEIERMRQFFAPPSWQSCDASADDALVQSQCHDNADFAAWVNHNVSSHKIAGYSIVTIALKGRGETPGDASAEQMEVMANAADAYSFGELRISHEQNVIVPHVRKQDLYPLWQQLTKARLAHANGGLLSDIICCPGMDYCALATARSIPVARRIGDRFKDLSRQHDIGDLRIKISGCINACGHHHVGHIGILGVDRRGEEYYQITLGGHAGSDASIGEIIGPAFSSDAVVDAVETIVNTYLRVRRSDESFLHTWRRVGKQPFKESLYAAS